MQQLLPYHEMSVISDNKKIVRLIEIQEGDEFHTEQGKLHYLWHLPGAGAFGYNAGTNFMLGNDFMFVANGRDIVFDNQFPDSKIFMLIVDIRGIRSFLNSNSLSFFDKKDLEPLIAASMDKDAFIVHFPESKDLIKVMDLIISDFNDLPEPDALVIIDVIRLLNRLSNLSDKNYNPLMRATNREPVLYAVKKIREDYRTITLDSISEEMNYSKTYISNILKEVVGLSFEEMVHYRKEVVGTRLLKNRRIPLRDIATELGFSTYAGFYKFWKKRMGMSPEEYRKYLISTSDANAIPGQSYDDY